MRELSAEARLHLYARSVSRRSGTGLHTAALYDGFRKDEPNRRALILSRDVLTGAQANGTIFWSSDIYPTWDTYKRQIPTGLNFTASGIAYWSNDTGGWQWLPKEHHPAHPPLLDPSDARDVVGGYDDFPELYTRWFQYATFLPNMRTHGSRKYNEVWSYGKQAEPILEKYLKLRYELMPYIYSNGDDTYFKDGTVMRGLVMDFSADKRTWDIADEYMFGPAFLEAPVTEFKARSRKVYLPANTGWYDFYTGRSVAGGQTITAAAPYERMPIYVRAGSIVPTGPEIQFTGNNSHAPLTLNVYTGANGSFSLYEDDGVSRQYLNGKHSRIPINWNEATKTLAVGEREGSYAGMAGSRTINVRWMKPRTARVLTFDAKADATITYEGRPTTIHMR